MGWNWRTRAMSVADSPHLVGTDRELFRGKLLQAQRYLEYGAGGSTVLAAQQGVETLCIESDARFAEAVRSKISELAHRVTIHYADIGPTGRWGRPLKLYATRRRRRRYPGYVYAPDAYVRDTFFDLVLIDGRFRVACALYVMRRAIQAAVPVTICFDDYRLRNQYRAVADYCEPAEVGKNMAFFRPLDTNLAQMPQDEDIRAFCKRMM